MKKVAEQASKSQKSLQLWKKESKQLDKKKATMKKASQQKAGMLKCK